MLERILTSIRGRYYRYYLYTPFRVHRLTTKLVGRRCSRSRSFIELDITYCCNLRCINCDRSCRQAPSTEEMTVEQIQKFIKESIDRNVQWKRIRVLGGEPTCHSRLLEILDLLLDYRRNYSADTQIQVVTNGSGEEARSVISRIPVEIEIENSSKVNKIKPFFPFNIAPVDVDKFKNADFSNGCWITSGPGIGLTPYGYYCCAVAGGIDRIFAFDIGRKELPSSDDTLINQLRVFCKLCGHFITITDKVTIEAVSPTWQKAYEEYKRAKQCLSLY